MTMISGTERVSEWQVRFLFSHNLHDSKFEVAFDIEEYAGNEDILYSFQLVPFLV